MSGEQSDLVFQLVVSHNLDVMAAIRSFICIVLPEELKAKIAELQSGLKREPVSVSWTKPENVHLTLKFLGDVEETRLEQVKEAISQTAQAHARFELIAHSCGVFPNEKNPRVLWVGLKDESGVLSPLVAEIEERLSRIGFAKEDRPFRVHLTIGRVRSRGNAQELARKLIASDFPAHRFPVERIVLMRSDLKPTGAVYTPLHSAELR
jgi:2'-5' RNA ligase